MLLIKNVLRDAKSQRGDIYQQENQCHSQKLKLLSVTFCNSIIFGDLNIIRINLKITRLPGEILVYDFRTLWTLWNLNSLKFELFEVRTLWSSNSLNFELFEVRTLWFPNSLNFELFEFWTPVSWYIFWTP